MTKTIFPLLIPGVLLLASCTSNPLVTADSTDAPAVEKVLLPIPPQPLVKDCGYDINDYFEALEQYNVGFGAAKKWFQSSNNGGANSNAYKRFEKNLLEFLKQSTRNETTVSLLRMEIGPHWVHSD
ncbi:MAG: hypothetical protein KJP25_12890, partial [Gammaproteobacteria bacterium]|nr:hypothetical protein [Gammaproteobacteria bacterium]